MITLKQHVESVSFINKGKTVSEYLDTLSISERIEYIRLVENTYPLDRNIKKPKSLKNVFLRIEQLVLGQFIMIEQIITGKTITPDHLTDLEILKLIVRPEQHKEFDNSDPVAEAENAKKIMSMDVREAYWVLNTFIQDRDKILFNDFSGVFYEKTEDEEEVDAEDAVANDKFSQQWYWYNIVRMLSGEDIHKYEQTYMLPMSIVLPEMSFLAQKNKIESARQRQSEAMRKL